MSGIRFQTATGSVQNSRGYANHDRCLAVATNDGLILAVSDGIGNLQASSRSADLAISTVCRVTSGGRDLASVSFAVEMAATAVRNLLEATGEDGGCTLTVAALAAGVVSIASLGDSPVWFRDATGIYEVFPTPRKGTPLREWLGGPERMCRIYTRKFVGDASLMVMSDGAHIPEDMWTRERHPDNVVDCILKYSQERGERDDITVSAGQVIWKG